MNNTIYQNYKAQRPLDAFFEKEGQMEYEWKGEKYNVNRNTLPSLPMKLQQSFTHYCATKYAKKKKITVPQQSLFSESIKTKTSTTNPHKIYSKEIKRREEIRKHLLRLATSTKIVEEKLNYPKVFQTLFSQPHLALEQLRKTEETKVNLTLIVDPMVGYHKVNKWFHNSIIETAKDIRGINLYVGNAVRGVFEGDKRKKYYPYYTELLKSLSEEQQQKIIVFTQGCGEIADNYYENISPKIKSNIVFCTYFHKYDNCGCNSIKIAELAKLSVKYGIRSPEDLKYIS